MNEYVLTYINMIVIVVRVAIKYVKFRLVSGRKYIKTYFLWLR